MSTKGPIPQGEPLNPIKPDSNPPEDAAFDRHALDPAQKSLADALRITYRIIQLVMVVLFALFILSGFETVGEGERGVSLTFGAINQSDLPPGQQFQLPYPVGELITVHTGASELSIDRDFYPGRNASGPPRVSNVRRLKPGRDGSMLTGDGAIVHAQWTAVYRVADEGVADFVRNVQPQEVRDLVRAAVKRGAVRTVAGLTVEDFLKQTIADESFVGEAAIEARVREIAQRTLDDMQTGILLERVTLDERSPPGFVKDVFDEVSRQTAEAASAREEAEQYAREQLNAVAGGAAERLIELIDDFEAEIDRGRDDQAEEILARIDAILTGEPVDTPAGQRVVSGEVTRIISEAEQYRTNVITRAQSAADRFAAKLDLYRDNPAVFVSTEWASAYADFVENAQAQVFAMPRDSAMELVLNRDPDIARSAEAEQNAAEATQTIEQRVRDVLENQRRQRERREAGNDN